MFKLKTKYKQILMLTLLALFVSCSAQESEDAAEMVEETTKTQEETVETSIEFPEKYLGTYISSVYLTELEKHGSTKTAQEKTEMSTVSFSSSESGDSVVFFCTWGFHEGSNKDDVKMISASEAVVISSYSKDTVYHIDFFEDGKMQIKERENNYEFVQYAKSNDNQSYTEMVNQKILQGEFSIAGQAVDFKSNGEILGLDSITNYVFHEDYMDAGMEYDMVYLNFSDGREKEAYGYSLTNRTLTIFNLICLEMDEEYGYCMEREKGKDFLTFNRNKQNH